MARGRGVIAVITSIVAIVLAFLLIDQLTKCTPGEQGNGTRGMSAEEALGATLEPLDRGTAATLGLAGGAHGLVVTSVSSKGPAALAGIRAGDVIESVGSTQINSIGDIGATIGDGSRDVALTLNRHRHYVIVHVRTWPINKRQGPD